MFYNIGPGSVDKGAFTLAIKHANVAISANINFKKDRIVHYEISSLGDLKFCRKFSFKAGLHNGDYHSKLVPFEAHKNIFCI
jgi:hypothetical protein